MRQHTFQILLNLYSEQDIYENNCDGCIPGTRTQSQSIFVENSLIRKDQLLSLQCTTIIIPGDTNYISKIIKLLLLK